MSLKPICVPCGQFYRPERNGQVTLEQMPQGTKTQPGLKTEPQNWSPYKLWRSDLWKCHGCGHLLVVGSGQSPFSERHEEGFGALLESYRKDLVVVNDC